MKLVSSILLILSLTSFEVSAEDGKNLNFYKAGQLVSTRVMTEDEARSYEALQVSNQVMAIIEKGKGQSTLDKKRLIDVFIGVTDIEEDLKRELTSLSLALEFDASATDYDSNILMKFLENHEAATMNLQKKISEGSKVVYDEVKVAGKNIFP